MAHYQKTIFIGEIERGEMLGQEVPGKVARKQRAHEQMLGLRASIKNVVRENPGSEHLVSTPCNRQPNQWDTPKTRVARGKQLRGNIIFSAY